MKYPFFSSDHGRPHSKSLSTQLTPLGPHRPPRLRQVGSFSINLTVKSNSFQPKPRRPHCNDQTFSNIQLSSNQGDLLFCLCQTPFLSLHHRLRRQTKVTNNRWRSLNSKFSKARICLHPVSSVLHIFQPQVSWREALPDIHGSNVWHIVRVIQYSKENERNNPLWWESQ